VIYSLERAQGSVWLVANAANPQKPPSRGSSTSKLRAALIPREILVGFHTASAESGPSLRAGDRQKPAYSGRFDLSVQWCVFSGKQTYRWGRGLMGEKINWSSIDHSFLSAMFHLFEFSTGSSNLTFETN
jgi:hypothetical protein